MVYLICEGNPAGRDAALGMTYPEAYLWLCFKKYDGWHMEHTNGK